MNHRFLPTRDGRVVSLEGEFAAVLSLEEAERQVRTFAVCFMRHLRAGHRPEATEEYVIALDDACRAARHAVRPVGETDASQPRPSSITPE